MPRTTANKPPAFTGPKVGEKLSAYVNYEDIADEIGAEVSRKGYEQFIGGMALVHPPLDSKEVGKDGKKTVQKWGWVQGINRENGEIQTVAQYLRVPARIERFVVRGLEKFGNTQPVAFPIEAGKGAKKPGVMIGRK